MRAPQPSARIINNFRHLFKYVNTVPGFFLDFFFLFSANIVQITIDNFFKWQVMIGNRRQECTVQLQIMLKKWCSLRIEPPFPKLVIRCERRWSKIMFDRDKSRALSLSPSPILPNPIEATPEKKPKPSRKKRRKERNSNNFDDWRREREKNSTEWKQKNIPEDPPVIKLA